MDITTRGQAINPNAIQHLIDQYLGDFKGAIVNHVTIQCRDQGRLLEEATRDLEVFKKAYYKAEREIRDRDAMFEQEKRVLNDKIHQLEVRPIPHIQRKAFDGCFKFPRHNLVME